MQTSSILPPSSTPSLLRQIVDEVDNLDIEKQEALLRRLTFEKMTAEIKALDKELEGCQKLVSEDEIADIVSNYRSKKYEESLRH